MLNLAGQMIVQPAVTNLGQTHNTVSGPSGAPDCQRCVFLEDRVSTLEKTVKAQAELIMSL